MDIKELKNIIRTKVTDPLDHKNINLDVHFMQNKIASTEVLAIAIFEELKIPIESRGVELHSVKLYETENNFVEYLGQ